MIEESVILITDLMSFKYLRIGIIFDIPKINKEAKK